jgi:Autographiviridae exonuclease
MNQQQLLIDGDILAYQIASSCQEKVLFEETISLTVNTKEMVKMWKSKMAHLEKKLKCKIGYVCFSGPTSANFRKDVLKTYKENRKAVEKPIGHAWLVEWAEKHYGEKFKRVHHLEADDLMGIMSTKPGTNFIVVSEDKDMQTFPGAWFNPRHHDEVVHIYPEYANWFHMMQTLGGDMVDNYKGLPGIGKVKAEKILQGKPGPQERWEAVVDAYGKAGLEETDALVQARCARILQHTDYNMKTKEVILWKPSKLLQMSTEKT